MKRYLKILFMILIFALLYFFILHQTVYINKSTSINLNDSTVAMLILDQLHNIAPNRILIISKDVCHVCLQYAVNTISTTKPTERINIIMLGASKNQIVKFNDIYNRFGIYYLHVDEVFYKEIEDNILLSHSLFIGAKYKKNLRVILYDGKEHKDISKRTAAVINFLIN